MKYHQQPYFYRYLDGKGAAATLMQRSLRFTSPRQFNDPFDFRLPLVPALTADELRSLVTESTIEALCAGGLSPLMAQYAAKMGIRVDQPIKTNLSREELRQLFEGNQADFSEQYRSFYDAHTERMNRELQGFFADQFVCCFTTDPSNLLMWSHYADKHRGAVLRFDCVEKMGSVFLAAMPVNYMDTPPPYGTKAEWTDLVGGGTGTDTKRIYREIVATKSLDWSYEHEWRISIPDPELKGQKHKEVGFTPRELSEVRLGCMMPAEQREMLVALIRLEFPQTRILEACMSSRAFELEFKDYQP